MAKSTNNTTHNKAKKRMVVKNSDKADSITPWKKKKGGQKQKYRRSVSWLEHLVLSNNQKRNFLRKINIYYVFDFAYTYWTKFCTQGTGKTCRNMMTW